MHCAASVGHRDCTVVRDEPCSKDDSSRNAQRPGKDIGSPAAARASLMSEFVMHARLLCACALPIGIFCALAAELLPLAAAAVWLDVGNCCRERSSYRS